MSWVEWVGIDWGNPLIQLRVWLTLIWLFTAVYGTWVLRSVKRRSSHWPIVIYSIVASMFGAASYFLGASATFSSITGFLIVGAILALTPVSMVLWLYNAKAREKSDV